MKKIVLLTGLAGAGRTTAADVLEDMGFYVIENLPSSIIKDVVNGMNDKEGVRLAIAVDIRDQDSIKHVLQARESLEENGDDVDIVFLDADDDTIIRRFEQTRRPHPFISAGVLTKGIAIERELLGDLLANCDVHIDTTYTNPTQLAQKLSTLFSLEDKGTTVVVSSFGFKHGLPRDADFIFDVRFLPNPFWEPELKDMSGLEKKIQDYVKSYEKYDEYISALKTMLDVSINEFQNLSKGFVTIAFGCTGGFHRSVTIADEIGNWLRSTGHKTIVIHRELDLSEQE
ncbi:MAG: RNase adapter RapZ [Acidimicrobiia bacterium]